MFEPFPSGGMPFLVIFAFVVVIHSCFFVKQNSAVGTPTSPYSAHKKYDASEVFVVEMSTCRKHTVKFGPVKYRGIVVVHSEVERDK